MEILIIIVGIILLIPCIKQIRKNKSANSIERVRAQFNYSAPTVDIRTLSPTEAKSYYHQLKNDGKEIDKNLLHDLSNIIGKEYEDMLLEELEYLVPEEVHDWIQIHVSAGLLFTDKVNDKIINLKINAISGNE